MCPFVDLQRLPDNKRHDADHHMQSGAATRGDRICNQMGTAGQLADALVRFGAARRRFLSRRDERVCIQRVESNQRNFEDQKEGQCHITRFSGFIRGSGRTRSPIYLGGTSHRNCFRNSLFLSRAVLLSTTLQDVVECRVMVSYVFSGGMRVPAGCAALAEGCMSFMFRSTTLHRVVYATALDSKRCIRPKDGLKHWKLRDWTPAERLTAGKAL